MKSIIIALAIVLGINAFADANKIAFDLIALNEGFRSNVYTCTAGKKTIGYGFTSARLVNKGYISKAEADKVLNDYIDQCMRVVHQLDIKVKLTDNQKAVLCDMVYHFGSGAIMNAKDLLSAINSGNANNVKTQLMRWNKQRVRGKDGKITFKVVAGLTNRQSRLAQLWDK